LQGQADRVFVAAQLELAEILGDRVQVGPGLPLPDLANHVHHAVAEVVAGGVEPLDFAAADDAVGQLVKVVRGEHDDRLGREPFPYGGRPAT